MDTPTAPAILVLGATGTTGRLVVEALERMRRPMVLAGRRRDALEALASGVAGSPPVRVADPTRPETLAGLFEGVAAVVNTVGPFRTFGIPVVEAAVAAGVHYADTTGEQAYQREVALRFDRPAREAGVAVVTGQAFEYAFGCAGAHVLEARSGPIRFLEIAYLVSGFGASPGTKKSALGMFASPWVEFRRGRFAPLDPGWLPRTVRFPGRRPRPGVAFPSGEIVLLPGEIPSLESVRARLVLPGPAAVGAALVAAARPVVARLLTPRVQAWLEARIDRRPAPPREALERARWSVLLVAGGPAGRSTCRIDGRDPYGITGDAAALGAAWLADGKHRATGVVSTGAAFRAEDFLCGLGGRGVTWTVGGARS